MDGDDVDVVVIWDGVVCDIRFIITGDNGFIFIYLYRQYLLYPTGIE